MRRPFRWTAASCDQQPKRFLKRSETTQGRATLNLKRTNWISNAHEGTPLGPGEGQWIAPFLGPLGMTLPNAQERADIAISLLIWDKSGHVGTIYMLCSSGNMWKSCMTHS